MGQVLGKPPDLRPVLFQDRLVRAILSGQKTETRRVARPQPEPVSVRRTSQREIGVYPAWKQANPCPYGNGGSWLYVRECWGLSPRADEYSERSQRVIYRADQTSWLVHDRLDTGARVWCAPIQGDQEQPDRWRPSIHLPRKLSRIWLRVRWTELERLRSLTDDAARLEGAENRAHFAELWDSVNGTRICRSWAANPWVWVVRFELISCSGPAPILTCWV